MKTWEELTIQDNFLFQKVMRNQRICKHLIEKILRIKIEEITYPEEEKTIDIRLDSKSIRLDVYVKDDKGRIYDIEMQVTNGKQGELEKRARYYQGMIDMELIEKGEPYENLNPCYVIFICTFDLFKKNLPMYTFVNTCKEDGELELGDESTKIFLNSKGDTKDIDSDVAAFLQYVEGHAPKGDFMKHVDEEVTRIKAHREWRRSYMKLRDEMTRYGRMEREKALAEGMEKGLQQGMQQGMHKGKLDAALSMLKNGIPMDMVVKCTELPSVTIEKIAKEHGL